MSGSKKLIFKISLKDQFSIPMDSSFHRQAFVFIFFVFVNLFSVLIFNHFVRPRGYEYEIIARNLLSGAGYSGEFIGGRFGPTAIMAPIYPWLIYLSFKIWGIGRWLPIQLFQAFLLSLTPLILLKIQRQIFPDHPHLSWGILFLPVLFPFTMYSAYIGPAAILTLCVTFGFYLLITAARKIEFHYFIGLGILTGITALIDPVPLLLFIIGFVWLLFQIPRAKINRWAIAVVIAIVIVSPWLYRNYRIFGNFPIFKNQMGWNLWWGNNPLAEAGIRSPEGSGFGAAFEALNPSERDSLKKMNEWELDRFYMRKSLNAIQDWIKTNPIGYLKLKCKCLLYFWFGNLGNLNIEGIAELKRGRSMGRLFYTLTLIPSVLLLVCSLTGLVVALFRRNSRGYAFLFLSILFIWAGVYSITHGHTLNRYRVPLDPILFLFSIFGLSWFINLLRHKIFKRDNRPETS